MTDRPKIPRHQRERIFQRSDGACQHCGCPIDIDTFHVSHLRAHIHGGAPVDENLEAWCSRCNLTQGAADVKDTRWTPREWQLEALDRIVKRITNDGVATVAVAPGGGKTLFAGLVFEALADAGVVGRMGILVPRRTLVDQWANALRTGRHLELKGDSTIERRGQHGVINCYQSLNTETIDIHRRQAEHTETLQILDEVHHVGESEAWARAVRELVGKHDGELHVRGVLNMSGTLWREKRLSSGRIVGKRISTVRYIDLGDGRYQSQADYTKTAESLIKEGQLRPVDIYRLNARVEIKDWKELTVTEADIADLDDEVTSRAVIAELPSCDEYREAFVSAVLDRLEKAHRALGRYHAKALIVAARQKDAQLFCDEVDKQMRARGLPPLAECAVSDEKDAARTLENFRRSKRVGVLCTCDMAGEGYDCPDIAVIGFASNKLTKLYVHQVVARAMRVTDAERRHEIIPAAIVVPDVKVLIDHLVKYLAPYSPDILEDEEPPPPPPPGSPRCFECDHYRKQHPYEGPCTQCECPQFIPKPKPKRFDIDNVEPTVENVTVSDGLGKVLGDFPREEIERFGGFLETVHLAAIFAPRTLAAIKLWRQDWVFDDIPDVDDVLRQAKQRRVTIEEHCQMLQVKLHKLEGWWRYNGDTEIAQFVAMINKASGIANGGREQATPEHLAAAVDYAALLITKHCTQTGKRLPKIMKNGDFNDQSS